VTSFISTNRLHHRVLTDIIRLNEAVKRASSAGPRRPAANEWTSSVFLRAEYRLAGRYESKTDSKQKWSTRWERTHTNIYIYINVYIIGRKHIIIIIIIIPTVQLCIQYNRINISTTCANSTRQFQYI
jgi:hypothetical protein